MSKTKIELPKKNEEGKSYISYSQYSKWKTSKKDYIKSYFLGERFEGNAYTEFGSLIGEALENNDFSNFSPKERELLSKVTRFDQFEREIVWDFGDFFVKGFIDTNDLFVDGVKPDVVTTIVDYKTGDSNKVSVYEADDYDQVAIYAGAIEQETGHLPTKGWVELIERTGNAFKGEELKLGGKIFTIPQDLSKKKIEQTRVKVLAVAKDISGFFKVFNKLNSIKV
jgi:hypothetical protein